MKVLVLNPDMTASMEEAPSHENGRMEWLQEKVGGYNEHVTFLKMTMDDKGVLTPERGSMFVNEIGALGDNPLPFNYLATLLYLENSRQRSRPESGDPNIIHGVAVVMPRAEE